MATQKENYNSELRIRGVSLKTKEQLVNIAKNQGITISRFLKPRLKDILDSFPDKMKQPPEE